jgi:hypothetical protein
LNQQECEEESMMLAYGLLPGSQVSWRVIANSRFHGREFWKSVALLPTT